MTDQERCPSCDKPVQSPVALLDHLEFGHQIEDPVGYLLELRHVPRRKYDRRPMLAWTGVVALLLAAVVGSIAALSGAGDGGSPDLAAVSSEPSAPAPTAQPDGPTPSTATAPASVATTITTTVTVAAPTTTATTVPAAPPTSEAQLAASDFRKPFLRDAHVVDCTTVGADDVYVVGFTLSGARDIVLGDEVLAGRSGDGDHEIEHAIPAGSTGWLDRIEVADGAGVGHAVSVTPPLFLGGCSA